MNSRTWEMWTSHSRSNALILLCVVLCGIVTGCSTETDGPDRYQISGTISYLGKPVPVGTIRFSPDSSQGNEGPGAMARIVDGAYETDSMKGTVGGAMIVEITGFDGVPTEMYGEEIVEGKPLFEPYRVEVDLPKEDVSQDFDVPEQK